MPSATLQSWQRILTTQRKTRSVQTKGRVYEKWTRQVQLEYVICNSPLQTKFGLWYWICSAKSAQWVHIKWAAAAKTPLRALVLLRPTFSRPNIQFRLFMISWNMTCELTGIWGGRGACRERNCLQISSPIRLLKLRQVKNWIHSYFCQDYTASTRLFLTSSVWTWKSRSWQAALKKTLTFL